VLLLLFNGIAAPFPVLPLDELIVTAPVASHGAAIQRPAVAGEWRFALELLDPAAALVGWHDITDYYAGDRHQFGADDYMGHARARLVTVELQAVDDRLAPWGQDTSGLFGVDVPLGAGLLMRAALSRVVSGDTVEWSAIWTGRVESWGDASAARGQIRTHIVSIVDTISDLANVPTIVDENGLDYPEYVEKVLLGAGWNFGVDTYGDESLFLIDLNPVVASARLDAISDPTGRVWRSLRTGRLVAHPAPWDTTNVDRYPNPLLDVYPSGLVFSYSPDFTEIEYIADDDQQPFGVSDTNAGVLNSFVVTFDDGFDSEVYPNDDPVSAKRFGVRPFTATWIYNNPPVVDNLLAVRAYASKQALPLRVTSDHEGFWSALAIVDHLDPVTIWHQTTDDGLVVTGGGWVRNIVEERTWRGDGLLSWQSTVQIDLEPTVTSEPLLPVEDLAFVGSITPIVGGPSSAEFTWVNPVQPSITPTNVQFRVIGRSLIWTTDTYPGVGADGANLFWLDPATNYRFQVRLIRQVDGVITNFSAIREVRFTTAARIFPIPTPGEDPGDTDVIGEPPEFECEDFEIDLQENDGSGWVTVDSFSGSELTPNGDGTYSLTYPIDNSFFNEGSMYRFRSTCDGITWIPGPAFDPPDDWTDPCTEPPALSTFPYNEPSLLVYVPKICAPDIIREAVSGIEAVHGDALLEIAALLGGDPNQRVLVAVPDPPWSDTAGGIVAYGECPQITGHTGDKTISVRTTIANNEACVLMECAALRITCAPSTGTDWNAGATVATVDGNLSVISGDLDAATEYVIAAFYDSAVGTLTLFVDDVEVDAQTLGGAALTINALPIWRVGAPPESWVTDCALWGEAVTPPATDLETAILALNPVGYWKLNELAGTTAIDYSGNARDGIYTNTPALGGQAGPDGDDYAVFNGTDEYVNIADDPDWSLGVNGMTVVAMVHPSAAGGERAVLAKAGPVSQNEYAFEASDDELRAIVWNPNGSEYDSCFASVFPDASAWNCMIWKVPDLFPGTAIVFRLNGTNLTITNNGGAGLPGDTTSDLRIAGRGHNDRYFPGALAHVALFAYGLSTAQMQSIENAAAADGWFT